jgi:hypothetical protein
MSNTEVRSYPRRVMTEGGEIEFRHMTAADEAAVLAFAQKLPVHDLLFIPRNISEPKVLSAWIKEIDRGGLVSLLAIKNGIVVGCGTIVRDPLSWSPMLAKSVWSCPRMFVASGWAGRCHRKRSRWRWDRA